MDVKTYILTFLVNNARMPDFENFIRYNRELLGYWNHIPLVYCVKTRLTASQLRDHLDPFFPQGGYMVAEINPANIDGRLPPDAWKWFYANPEPRGELFTLGESLLGNALLTSVDQPKGLLGTFFDQQKKK